MTERSYSVRQATSGDAEGILHLVSEMHGTDASRRIEWFYRSNPHGHAVTWVATDETAGEVEAVTSIFPRDVLVNGAKRKGSIGGDCYVLPTARRRGLATRLHAATRLDMRDAGIEFMYGPPLPHNLGALIKAGSREVTVFRRYTRPVSGEFLGLRMREALPRPLAWLLPRSAANALGGLVIRSLRALRSVAVDDHTLEPAGRFGAEWDAYFERNAPARAICCVRDARYLNFRYPEHERDVRTPFIIRRNGTLAGMLVLERSADGESMMIEDLFTDFDVRSIRVALQLAIDAATKSGCSSVRIGATPYPLLTEALGAQGFVERDRDTPWVFQLLTPEHSDHDPDLESATAWYFLDCDQDMGAGSGRVSDSPDGVGDGR